MKKPEIISTIKSGEKLACSHFVSETIKSLPIDELPVKFIKMRQFIVALYQTAEVIGLDLDDYYEVPDWNEFSVSFLNISELKLDELIRATRKNLSIDSPENFTTSNGDYEFSIWKTYNLDPYHWLVTFTLFESYSLLENTSN